ncbi:hypothetical protein C7212DRAFT_208906, partial [Tuber magnatum]
KLAKQFIVPHTTLQYRMMGRTPKADKACSSPILTGSEEQLIVQYISQLDLCNGGTPRKMDPKVATTPNNFKLIAKSSHQ